MKCKNTNRLGNIGIQVLDIANRITEVRPNTKISLLISGPICSKTIKFLDKESISINSIV